MYTKKEAKLRTKNAVHVCSLWCTRKLLSYERQHNNTFSKNIIKQKPAIGCVQIDGGPKDPPSLGLPVKAVPHNTTKLEFECPVPPTHQLSPAPAPPQGLLHYSKVCLTIVDRMISGEKFRENGYTVL